MPVIDTKKVMFEIYRHVDDGSYRVVYFTELGEHDKEDAISEALCGEHVYDGFILHRQRQDAKKAIADVVERMNAGESLSQTEISRQLGPFSL